MGDFVRDFKELRVYREGFSVAMELYTLSKSWPAEEGYALTDQVRRSSRAVCACIAEAWQKRRYVRHFASKISDAASEASETLVWIDFAQACGHLTESQAAELESRTRSTLAGLVRMAAAPEAWCPTSSVREDEADYFA